MQKIEVIEIDYKELQSVVGQFLGNPDYEDLIPDLYDGGWSYWGNDTEHLIYASPRDEWDEPLHSEEVASALRQKKIPGEIELNSVMDAMAEAGMIEFGTYLVRVSW